MCVVFLCSMLCSDCLVPPTCLSLACPSPVPRVVKATSRRTLLFPLSHPPRRSAITRAQVFIPESQPDPPLMSWDADTSEPRVAAAGADPDLYRSLDRPSRPAPTGPPSWWAPPPPPALPVSTAARAEALRQARVVLAALDDAKLLGGADYSPDQLLSLKRICQVLANTLNTCIDMVMIYSCYIPFVYKHVGLFLHVAFIAVLYFFVPQVNGISARPRADNARDAMFRAGVAAALTAAAAGGAASMGRLAGDTPAAFVSGLATALEVDDAAAWTIVHAAVAARGRSTLTDALAAQLRGDDPAVR